VQLYVYSTLQYGKSPYIYPIYGLGGLPEGFSRLCAIHGGTFMLNRPVDEVLVGDDGKAWGIQVQGEDGTPEVAKAPLIIGDPSYFPAEKLAAGEQVPSLPSHVSQHSSLHFSLLFSTSFLHSFL
jgi:Rab GDP dissociation inhibitor